MRAGFGSALDVANTPCLLLSVICRKHEVLATLREAHLMADVPTADKFLSESVRILAERLTQSELVPRLS